MKTHAFFNRNLPVSLVCEFNGLYAEVKAKGYKITKDELCEAIMRRGILGYRERLLDEIERGRKKE